LKKLLRVCGTKYNGFIDKSRSTKDSSFSLLCISIIDIAFLVIGCEINRLRSAEDLYNKGSYAGAIGELDELIRVGKNGAIVTRAELVRGNCYLELGKIATERGNLPLAIRFMKLSNSEASDVELGNIYKKLGEIENQRETKL
jgi:tetratricopeptide (TPR) repeat protein